MYPPMTDPIAGTHPRVSRSVPLKRSGNAKSPPPRIADPPCWTGFAFFAPFFASLFAALGVVIVRGMENPANRPLSIWNRASETMCLERQTAMASYMLIARSKRSAMGRVSMGTNTPAIPA